MTGATRRVVTTHDPAGAPRVASDGVPPMSFGAGDGPAVSEIAWFDGSPLTLASGGDRAGAGFPLEPPEGGASFRVIRLPAPAAGTPVDETWLRVAGDDPSRPGMHTTDTLDLVVVLEGEIVLGLDDGEHRLTAGDTVVQRGTAHRWRVIGDGPCTYAVTMLRPDPSKRRFSVVLGPLRGSPAAPAIIRRLVTESGSEGRSALRADGEPPFFVATPGPTGMRLVDLWQTGGPVTDVAQGGDRAIGEPWALEPHGGGVAWRLVELGAGHDSGERGWHATATIDIDVVLSGRLILELPDVDPVHLGPGDVVVQRGTLHRWRTDGDEPVRFLAVMLAVPSR